MPEVAVVSVQRATWAWKLWASLAGAPRGPHAVAASMHDIGRGAGHLGVPACRVGSPGAVSPEQAAIRVP